MLTMRSFVTSISGYCFRKLFVKSVCKIKSCVVSFRADAITRLKECLRNIFPMSSRPLLLGDKDNKLAGDATYLVFLMV